MANLIERLGLDWFVLLVGKPAFEDTPPSQVSLPEIREKLGDLRDEAKLDDAVEYCGSLLKHEEDRSDKIESKAFTLIGITGIATGFITSFAGLLLDQSKISSAYVLIPAAIFYILVVISLMWTIFLAVKVVIVGDYWFTYPSASDILQLSDATLAYVKRERAISLFYSFVQNRQVVNRKATFLSGAQLWFRNSIVLLLALTLLLALYTPFKSSFSPPGIASPVGSPIVVTPSTTTPAGTPQPTFTPTIIAPTDSPTVTPTMIVPLSPTLIVTPIP